MKTTQLIETARFGTIEFCDADLVTLAEGILGFPGQTRYLVIQHKEGSPFCWLQSADDGALAFLVVDPAYYVPDYAPELPDETARQLELGEETPRLVYTIVTIPKGKPDDMTLNLAGPILINLEKRLAKQVVVEDVRYAIRHRVFPKEEMGQTAA
ncbi:MAG: flagellar assembly protein FliW [Armatimonadetes bacterium]|nr:flagellar assembly protein FliW [Armatimonadota bacterium]MBX3108193.1 flagellar assembly protein FliW [Fimbriimonadaceae bacterium]